MRRIVLALLLGVTVAVALVGAHRRHSRSKPEWILRHLVRAGDTAAMGDRAAAIREYRAVLALDPCQHEARSNLAQLYEETGDHRAALRELEAGVRADPHSLTALNNLGFAHYAAGRYDEALRVYQVCARMEPRNTYWRTFVGRCYWRSGDTARAQEQFAAILRTDPNNDAARHGFDSVVNAPRAAR